jgi:crotonobetainyl-CoA:carnitine CoA-transferase CaiB-like acyl-CoA transferase
MSLGVMAPEAEHVPNPPAPAFGDSIGAMTIAGGIMGALLHRERTGEATTVDVSLLGTAMWSMGAALALSLQLEMPWRGLPAGQNTGNPLVSVYKTKDARYLSLSCLQAGKYWAELCELVGRPELVTDERFTDAELIKTNAEAGSLLLAEAFLGEDAATWRERLAGFSGQWTMVQDTLEAAADPQTVANGLVQECQTAEGVTFKLAAAPVQFGGEPAAPSRAPAFNEQGDAILEQLGYDWDAIVDLKVRGVVA